MPYDRPIGPLGLLWRNLQAWFDEHRGVAAWGGDGGPLPAPSQLSAEIITTAASGFHQLLQCV